MDDETITMIFDIVKYANTLFQEEPVSCKEILFEFKCEYQIKKQNLPSVTDLRAFFSCIPSQDRLKIYFNAEFESAYCENNIQYEEKYENFINNVDNEEEITVSVNVDKVIENGRLSVYSFRCFTDFLYRLGYEELFENFTTLFSKCDEQICFLMIDGNGSLRTNSIAFTESDVVWTNCFSREEKVINCQEAGIFLDREKIRLIPQDFEIKAVDGHGFDKIFELFEKLKNILSFIYLANTATIVSGKAVLQFDPSATSFEFDLKLLEKNIVVAKIFNWVFTDDNCVDKVCIARRIISLYCKDSDAIIKIGENVLNSVKSDYIIYQKNHVDQYIEMKNKISDYIVDSVEKIQNMSHDIADAFRNNFVAIVVFFITVILTDSIDLSQLFGDKGISPNFAIICWFFTFATLVYFVVSIIICKQKWNWLEQSYNNLKNNYKDVFDKADIEEAFNNDEPIKGAEKQVKKVIEIIAGIWIALIIALVSLTCVLTKNSLSNGQEAEKNKYESATYQTVYTANAETITSSTDDVLTTDESSREARSSEISLD